MGAIANAVQLIDSPDFRKRCSACAIYTASVVMVENASTANHARRKQLAAEVLQNPQVILDRLVGLVAGSPEIASVSGNPAAIPDEAYLTRTAAVWNLLADLMYGNVVTA